MSNPKWCIVIPSYRGSLRLEKRLIPSWLRWMPNVPLCLFLQGFDEPSIRRIKAIGNDNLRVVTHDVYNPVCMPKVRQDARDTFTDGYDYFLWTDDDVMFKEKSYECYQAAFKYLEEHKQCGYVQCNGYVGSNGWVFGEVRPHIGKSMFFCSLGIAMRNEGFDCGHRVPNVPLPDDLILPAYFYSRGYYIGQLRRCPTLHYGDRASDERGKKNVSTWLPGGLTTYAEHEANTNRIKISATFANNAKKISQRWFSGYFQLDPETHSLSPIPEEAYEVYAKAARERFGCEPEITLDNYRSLC